MGLRKWVGEKWVDIANKKADGSYPKCGRSGGEKRKNYPKTYDQWYKGGITTNPITWDESITTSRTKHLGTLNSDEKIYENAIDIKIIDGLIWSSVPRIPKRFLLSFIKSYHFADVNLFWKDIEVNALLRAEEWKRKYTSK